MSELQRTITFREILDLPDVFLKQHFRKLLAVALPGQAIATVPAVVMNLFSLEQKAIGTTQAPDLTLLLLMYGLMFLGAFVSAMTMLAIIRSIALSMDGAVVGVAEAYRFAVHPARLLTVTGLSFAAMLGCCFCVLPGVVTMMGTTFLLPVLAHEGLGTIASVKRGFRLATWIPPSGGVAKSPAVRLLGVWVFYFLLTQAMSGFTYLVMLLGGGLKAISDIGSGAGGSPIPASALIASSIVAAVFACVVLIYTGTCVVLLYRDTRYRREAPDLEAALDARLSRAAGGAFA